MDFLRSLHQTWFKSRMSKLLLLLSLAFSASVSAALSCNYNQAGIRFYMVIPKPGVATGGLHAQMGQQGFSFNTDFAFRYSDISELNNASEKPSFKVYSKRGQSEVNVVVNAGLLSIRYKGTDGEWAMEDAPIKCQ